jgi:Ssp1 endopeptidase immunity protein Rap1a
MGRSICLVACYLAITTVTPATADFTGNDLYDLCTERTKEADSACNWWMIGYTSGFFSAPRLTRPKDEKSCLNGVTAKQVRLVVEKFMREYPRQPWFWTITARQREPSLHDRGYAASRG